MENKIKELDKRITALEERNNFMDKAVEDLVKKLKECAKELADEKIKRKRNNFTKI